jgi:tungstate transport system substrate-binding protein
MSTTTSTEGPGLLTFLLPPFEAKCACKVRVIAVGTGKALEIGKNGDVDVVLVHARPAEDRFVAEGHGVSRRDVMYNDFIIAVNPQRHPGANFQGAIDLINWITSPEGRRRIAGCKVNGEQRFFPAAN